MSGLASRRGFLRGLTTLPLIGGSVALIGAPSAVALPTSRELLDSYDAWLDMERRFLKWERFRSTELYDANPNCQCVWYDKVTGRRFDWVPLDNLGAGYHMSDDPAKQPQPSSRAALVLSAVGCSWQGGRG
ncbi:hypothetical protein [Methylobacterium sp. Leaf361]|uniref:hypothetical protein n=1 Tax=Methylobacterium sp. Leaf361 TaxID=1736352 RepID=UPI000A7D1C1F|nr:hypothetical protein [Methylobacterium sp. Leaf361]